MGATSHLMPIVVRPARLSNGTAPLTLVILMVSEADKPAVMYDGAFLPAAEALVPGRVGRGSIPVVLEGRDGGGNGMPPYNEPSSPGESSTSGVILTGTPALAACVVISSSRLSR